MRSPLTPLPALLAAAVLTCVDLVGCGAGAALTGGQGGGPAARPESDNRRVRTGSVLMLSGHAVARQPASALGASCRGFVPASPSFVVELPEALPMVGMRVSGGEADTVLVVRDSAGTVRCNDDGGGWPNPAIGGAFAAGPLEIWVGLFADEPTTAAPFSVEIGTTAPVRLADAIPGVPHDCGMSSPDYGPLAVGMDVFLGIQDIWSGPDGRGAMVSLDDGWDDDMWAYVGVRATVASLDGIDAAGCPVIRVDRDEGLFAWRIRDLREILAPEGPSAAPIAGVPLDCGLSIPSYGSLVVGATVVLGAHGGWSGANGYGGTASSDRWWHVAMWAHVGERTTVTELAGLDRVGCPIVHVDADSGRFAWRIRSLSDVGPPDPSVTVHPPWPDVPAHCGMTIPDYRPLRVGSSVVLGAHREWTGPNGVGAWANRDTWWNEAMAPYVGRRTTVIELGGLDPVGCPFVRVAIDGGSWGWRVRDLLP